MKSRTVGITLWVLFVSLTSLKAFHNISFESLVETQNSGPNFFGVWDCKVVGAAPEYQHSILFITKQENGLPSVIVQLDRGSLTGQDVGLGEKVLRFNINPEGVERVSVVLEADVDQLTGKVYTSGGALPVTCTRKSPPK